MIKPYGKRIVVKREEVAEQVGGLYIPDSVREKEKPRKGVVLATCENSDILIGDTVIFGKFAGLELEEEKVLILKLEDVHAVVKLNS